MCYEKRIGKVRAVLAKEGMDVFMLADSKNILYLTGFEDGRLLISSESKPILIVPILSSEEAEDAAHNVLIKPVPVDRSLKDVAVGVLKALKLSAILYDTLSISEYRSLKSEGFKLKDGSSYIADFRRAKSLDEIRLMREASRLTKELMEVLIAYAKPGVRECDLAREADVFLRDRGLEYAFPIIAVSGFKTSNPHGKPSLKRILEGEPVTIDLGVRYKGYCSDMTRSFVVGRNLEYERLLEDVQEAQKAALDSVKAGVSCRSVDEVARGLLKSKGYDGLFIHSLGHGVGLDIHEPPTLGPLSKEILVDSDVVTVEPGVYVKKKFGCRIEDTVLVRKNGYEPLTS